jgi:hypothetical protein
MASKSIEGFNNLLDACIKLEDDPQFVNNAKLIFHKLISDYFFKSEIKISKNIELFIGTLKPLACLENTKNIYDINIADFSNEISGVTFDKSIAGSVMLSGAYLKAFYPHHTPAYSKLPEDIKFELKDKIEQKNTAIIESFNKMKADMEADSRRKIVSLIALIIKNIHLRSGLPLCTLQKSAEEIIRGIFNCKDDIFTASERQNSELRDDSRIKDLVKIFFEVRQFKEIAEISEMYKNEFDRYRRRVLRFKGV